MKVLIAICCIVVAVYAQAPRPCNSPAQWESREWKSERDYQEFRKLSYDESNKREREIAEVVQGSQREFYDRLYLFNENRNYTLNLRTRQCTVTPINRPFRYRGVHPNAKFEGIFEIGAVGVPGEVVAVQAFSANETDGSFYTGLVTYPDCYPVRNFYFSRKYGFEHSDYFDLNIGIIDLNVFVPPTECMAAEEKAHL